MTTVRPSRDDDGKPMYDEADARGYIRFHRAASTLMLVASVAFGIWMVSTGSHPFSLALIALFAAFTIAGWHVGVTQAKRALAYDERHKYDGDAAAQRRSAIRPDGTMHTGQTVRPDRHPNGRPMYEDDDLGAEVRRGWLRLGIGVAIVVAWFVLVLINEASSSGWALWALASLWILSRSPLTLIRAVRAQRFERGRSQWG